MMRSCFVMWDEWGQVLCPRVNIDKTIKDAQIDGELGSKTFGIEQICCFIFQFVDYRDSSTVVIWEENSISDRTSLL